MEERVNEIDIGKVLKQGELIFRIERSDNPMEFPNTPAYNDLLNNCPPNHIIIAAVWDSKGNAFACDIWHLEVYRDLRQSVEGGDYKSLLIYTLPASEIKLETFPEFTPSRLLAKGHKHPYPEML